MQFVYQYPIYQSTGYVLHARHVKLDKLPLHSLRDAFSDNFSYVADKAKEVLKWNHLCIHVVYIQHINLIDIN